MGEERESPLVQAWLLAPQWLAADVTIYHATLEECTAVSNDCRRVLVKQAIPAGTSPGGIEGTSYEEQNVSPLTFSEELVEQ